MSSTKTPPSAADFQLDIGDDLLAAALASVEKRLGGESQDPNPAEMDAFEEDVVVEFDDAEDDGELLFEAELDFDDDAPGSDDSVDPGDDELAGLRAALRAANARTADAEERLATIDKRRDEVERLLGHAVQERRRLTAAANRMKERAQHANAGRAAALEARSAAETRATQAEQVVERLRDDLRASHDRRRRELEAQKEQAIGPVVLSLLPVLDNLELAQIHAAADPSTVVDGVKMIVHQFSRAIDKLGVQRIGARPGAMFRPEVHEAMQQVITNDFDEGRIVDEVAAGYTIKGRLLRAARVSVASPPPPAQADLPPVAPSAPAAPSSATADNVDDNDVDDDSGPQEPPVEGPVNPVDAPQAGPSEVNEEPGEPGVAIADKIAPTTPNHAETDAPTDTPDESDHPPHG